LELAAVSCGRPRLDKNLLQGAEIAHFVEGKGNPGAAFPVVLARVLGTKGAFRRQKALISARKGEL
jgi:hypothetical protein